MTQAKKNRILYLIAGVFIALSAVFLYFEQFWFLGLPIVLAVVAVALFRLDWLFLLITLLTPLSINVENIGGGFGLHLPTEPVMFGLMLVFLFRVFHDGYFDSKVMRHPLTLAIFINTFWIFITCLTSEEPLVSVKFLISRLWFVVGFFFIATQVFRDSNNIVWHFWRIKI